MGEIGGLFQRTFQMNISMILFKFYWQFFHPAQ